MNTEHKSINDIVPHGEFIRGFANQSFLTNAELHRIMKSRGIFFSFQDKNTMVPILQTLLLSPKEFDEIRECFNTKEDNKKVISRSIDWADKNAMKKILFKDFSNEDRIVFLFRLSTHLDNILRQKILCYFFI